MTSGTSATSEGAHGIFSKITFFKLVHSKEKDEACLGFLFKTFTKSVHRVGVSVVNFGTENYKYSNFMFDSTFSMYARKKVE